MDIDNLCKFVWNLCKKNGKIYTTVTIYPNLDPDYIYRMRKCKVSLNLLELSNVKIETQAITFPQQLFYFLFIAPAYKGVLKKQINPAQYHSVSTASSQQVQIVYPHVHSALNSIYYFCKKD